MRRYLAGAVAKELRGGKALFLLAVAGVALGVAAVLSIQVLNRGALGAFTGAVRAVSGEVDATVLGLAGALDETLLPEVLGTPGVAAALPIWRADLAVEGRPGASLEVVGVDLLAPSRRAWSLGQGGLEAALGEPGWVALTPALAAEQGWKVGDAVEVSLGARRVRLRVGALVDLQKVAPLAPRRLAVMDLAQAQGLLGTRGRIHQIDVVAAPGVSAEALVGALAARLGARARVTTPEARAVEAAGLLAAFRLNLTALSLVSLFVGGFLVFASVRASLARRREELGVLRAVGATRAQVLSLVLAEAALLGALGTAAGIPLGWLAARANLSAVSSTLRNVYLLEGIEQAALTPGLVALAIGTGLAGALLGALWPAADASRTDPRALLSPLTLEEQLDRRSGALLAAAGVAVLVTAAVPLLAGGAWAGAGFVPAVGLLVAAPLATPAALVALTRTGRPRRLGLRHGVRTAGARVASAAPAAGALAVAVAMLAALTIMVGSFRETVVRWLDATLHADVYVTTPSWRRSRSEATLGPEVLDALARLPGAVAVDRLRQHQGYAVGAGPDRRITISGIDAGLPGGERRVALLSGDGRAAMAALRRGGVLVSEPLARKARLAPGGTLSLRTPGGERAFPVAGVYRDYGSEGGAVLLDLATYAGAFGPGPASNAAVYLEPGRDPEAAVAAVRTALPDAALQVRSNRTLRSEVLSIFEETFAVTRLLRAMGLVIAAAGVTLSLLVLARERRAELALYRALGAARGQLFRVFLGRGLAIGLSGLVLGALSGAALAWVLVGVINPAYFGWTLGWFVPWHALLAEGAVILLATILASVYPALAASRTPAAELSRDAL